MWLLPPYLIILTVVLVVIPAVVAMYLRFSLHKTLRETAEKVSRFSRGDSPGIQPKIVEILQERFSQASQNLEQVNTDALIDQVYSQQKILEIPFEQIDYFCSLLPNLLLAFGLMGTFIGITMNLTSLSQTIQHSQANDVNTLIQELQQPLQGMGIAFVTSLIGLLLSAIMTLTNFIWNTTLAKHRLISLLEDYLDNIYYPTLEGQTRLDKVVKTMADQFQEFLTRFGATVREGVESALKDNIQEITQGNVKALELAQQVYSQLANASGTLERGAVEFQTATQEFKTTVQVMEKTTNQLEKVAESFENSQFPLKLSEVSTDLADTQIVFSDSISNLINQLQSVETIVNQCQIFSQQFVEAGTALNQLNQNSQKLLELHHNNQQSLAEMIPKLQEGSASFESAVQTLEQIHQEIDAKADSWQQGQETLANWLEKLNDYSSKVNSEIGSLTESLAATISDQMQRNSQEYQASTDKLQKTINVNNQRLATIKIDLASLLKLLKDKIELTSDQSQSENTNFKTEKRRFF